MYYKNPNYHYVSNIPKSFRRKTDIDKYNFLILEPSSRLPAELIKTKDGRIERISNAAYCLIKKTKERIHVIIEKDKFPALYDSVVAVSYLRPFTPYIDRYMRLYKSFEALDKNIDFNFRAIRHGLSHSPHVLLNQKTVEALERLFGTKYIDLSKLKHKKVFYVYFSKLLIEHDKILYRELIKKINVLKTAKRIIRNSVMYPIFWDNSLKTSLKKSTRYRYKYRLANRQNPQVAFPW